MSFHVGQKVECIDASLPANPWHRAHPLVKGSIYVVTEVNAHSGYVSIDGSLRLWEQRRFRPITERSTETGMAILRRICADHKQPIRERV